MMLKMAVAMIAAASMGIAHSQSPPTPTGKPDPSKVIDDPTRVHCFGPKCPPVTTVKPATELKDPVIKGPGGSTDAVGGEQKVRPKSDVKPGKTGKATTAPVDEEAERKAAERKAAGP